MNGKSCARVGLAASMSVLIAAGTVRAAGHTWRVTELFSNSDGSIQFIELRECCGFPNEFGVGGQVVTSDATGSSYMFPGNVAGSTALRHILLATAAFAALPNAPTPDHIIPAGFINIGGDTISFAPKFNLDCFTFANGELPTDGTLSIHVTGIAASCDDPFTLEPNTPTNYAWDTATINAADCVDGDGDGYGITGHNGCPNGFAIDCDDAVDVVHPNATEMCDGAIDHDCDGLDDCEEAACCDDDDTCTQEQCGIGGICESMAREYGDANNDGAEDIFDILCVLDGFAGVFNVPCTLTNLDFSPCPGGDGAIDIFDILAALDGFGGVNACGCPAGP
ncbi:MAG: hypothetical protein HOP29_12155 [Phycisphaerales bacterium]|nr:hypothetical protein [Phycisphaerales bacterium]